MGRDENTYVSAGSFRPERWMKKDRCVQAFDQYKFPVFQAGNRICLGKDLAIYEIKVLLVELLRKFRFEMPRETAPKDRAKFEADVALLNGEPVYQYGITLSYKGDLNLDVYKR